MQSYEALVRCVAAACDAPMATLAVVEGDRAYFKASFGAVCAEEVPLTFSLLAETLACEDVFTVADTHAQERFARSPVVIAGPRVRAFAGIRLHGADGSVVGVLAIADKRPGTFSPKHLAALRDFGEIASSLVFSRRELALRRLMSRAIEEALDFVLLTDASPPSQGGPFIEYANASLLHALGYTADELAGKPYCVLFAPTNDPVTLESIARNIEAAKDNEKEIQLRRKDGNTFWVEFTGRPLLEADGSVSHWVSVGRDITANREALAQTAAFMKALDTVSEHIEIYARANGEYFPVFVNSAADAACSAAAQTLLQDQATQRRLQCGERIQAGDFTLQPLGNGQTVICARPVPPGLAAAS